MSDIKPFHGSQFLSLTAAVQREIERQIIVGELPAGTRLSEVSLAARLGVSRGPVREAIRSLTEAGLLDHLANRGAVVRIVSRDEALALYDFRSVIFGFACERAAQVRSGRDLADLEELLGCMAAAIERGETPAYYPLNLRFHARILEMCGNRRVRATYEQTVKELQLFRRRALGRLPNIKASFEEHRQIVEAIAAGEPARAFVAGRSHVGQGRERFEGTLVQEEDEAAA